MAINTWQTQTNQGSKCKLDCLKRDVASRTESQKLNNFSNFKSVVCELCRISLYLIKGHRDASKLEIFNWDRGEF